MIEFLLINKVLMFLINAVALWLAFLVYHNNPKREINKLFILMTVSMLLWVNFAFLARYVGQGQIYQSLLFIKIAWFVTPLLFLFLSLVAVYIIKEEKKYRLLNKIVLFLGVIAAFITGFTNLVIKGIKFENGNLIVVYGKGMIPFLAAVMFLMYTTLYPLFKKYFKSLEEEKKKIEFFLIGIFIFYLANIIFNIVLPIKFKVSQYYYIGDYSTIFLLGFTAYSIVKHELFGIKVILTSIFVALIAILLALDIFVFTPELLIQLFKSLLLVIFLYFGYLLIKSVLQEIERREELEKLSRQLKKANAHLEKLLELRKELMHIVSHQLRAPLTVIRGMISMWCAGDFKNLSKKEKDDIKRKIYLSTEQLNNIVNDLLETMKFEEGYFKFKFKPVSIEELITEAINILKPNYEKKGLYIKFKRLSKTFPKIQADREYLKQVFLNIIDNAEKYTFKGGAVITISQKDRNLLVEISDSGIGISLEDQKKIFKKFSRSQKSKKINATGSGLGLYIAKQIIEAHSGKIEVKSKGENKGAAFIITLPIIQAKKIKYSQMRLD